jgi:large subunit ribosomal protein L20
VPRAKGGSKSRQRRKKIMKMAKGYVGGRGRLYRSARETVERALAFAYRDRRV